jgi:uncharacterized protein (TIGR02145 family)
MKNKIKNRICFMLQIGLIFILSVSCKDFESKVNAQETGSFTDPRDGKTYNTVKIGTQWIMAENFAYKPNRGNFRAYDNDTANVSKFGYLYDWETALNIAPEGWHVPSIDEWKTLRKELGGKLEIWTYMEKVYPKLIVGGGSGFNAVFGGMYSCNGRFTKLGEETIFWSSTREENGMIWIYGLDSNKNNDPHGLTGRTAPFAFYNGYATFCSGYSVRLFKDQDH